MAFPFTAPALNMETPVQRTVFMGRDIAVDRDELPNFMFDAEPEPDFSDSNPENDDEAVRAFNEVVLADAQVGNEASEDEEVNHDAVDLLKQHEAEVDNAGSQPSQSLIDGFVSVNAPENDDAVPDEEDEGVIASSIRSVKKAVAKAVKSPAKKTANKPGRKPAAKPATKTATKSPAKKRMPRNSKTLPAERPSRISDRVSKPPPRIAAQTGNKPGSKPVGVVKQKKKTTPKPAKRQTTGQRWEVETIVDSVIDADTYEQMYLVKWKGYASKDNTWEPKINLGSCQAAIKAFEKGNNKRSKRKET